MGNVSEETTRLNIGCLPTQMGHQCENTMTLMRVDNESVDQPAHERCLVSFFVLSLLENAQI